MIVEGCVDLFFTLIDLALSGFEVVGLPLQAINALNTILCYGVWVVGLDIMSIFASCVIFWWSLKFTVGLVVWVWELLPLT